MWAYFQKADYQSFMAGITTVTGKMAYDRAKLDRKTFLYKYGHLRPGTYDILSPRYDEDPDKYFDWGKTSSEPEAVSPFSLTLPQMRKIDLLLKEHNLQTDPVELLNFMQFGIELREEAKFDFSRNLSDAIEEIKKIGKKHGFSVNDLAYCDISVFKELYVGATDPKYLLAQSIEQGKKLIKNS